MKNLFQIQKFAPLVQLLFFFMFYFVGNMLMLMLMQLLSVFSIDTKGSTYTLIIMIGTQLLGFLLPAMVFIKLIPQQLNSFLSVKYSMNVMDVFLLMLLAACTIFAVSGMSQLIMQLPLGETADSMQAQRKSMENAALKMEHFWQLPIRLFVMALLPAICEEIFFRGIVQRFMHGFTKSIFPAAALTAIIFALFHGSIYNILPIATAGVILGLVYYYTGNLLYSIVLHFIINGAQIIISYFQEGSANGEANLPLVYALCFLIGGIVAIYFITKQLIQRKKSLGKAWAMPFEAN